MRRIILLCSLLIPRLAFGAVGFDAVSSATGTGVASLAWNHTVTGANTLMLCGGHVWDFNGGTTINTFTYNSQALTLVADATNVEQKVYAYRRTAPTTSTNQASVEFSNNVNIVFGCMTFTGADQSSPVGTAGTDTDDLGSLSASIVVPANGMGASFAGSREAGASCVNLTSGNDERFDACNNTFEAHGLGSTTASTGSLSMTWTVNAARSAMVAVPINAVAGAAGQFRRRPLVIE